uniref:Ig-like domain-containing protein n=1 Tax=Panagrellus redivivus TaxID=6233 RepID=A0A7E4UM29_PANRE
MKFVIFLLPALAFAWPTGVTTSESPSDDVPACLAGSTFVRDNILYECHSGDGLTENKPIACAPEGSDKTLVQPGEYHVSEHFKYQCVHEDDDLVLKIVNCIDYTGAVVDLGGFFTSEDEEGQHRTTECLGDATKVKKTVHQWTKCKLANGKLLTEGNQHVEPLTSASVNKHPLQKGEIISCIRENKVVKTRCTGCVTEHTSIHLGVAGYGKVKDQWVQCRRAPEGCRLVNVTGNYLECQLTGSSETFASGTYFNDSTGISTYYCNHGHPSKQGCHLDGKWALVGEVVYTDGGEPLLCDSSAGYAVFNGLLGCTLEDGTVKKFQEVWRENDSMKRCSWTYDHTGINDSKIVSYACARGDEEVVPLNKVLQTEDGTYEKCAKDAATGELHIRPLTEDELIVYIKRKNLRIDLSEYFARGGRGRVESFTAKPQAAPAAVPAPAAAPALLPLLPIAPFEVAPAPPSDVYIVPEANDDFVRQTTRILQQATEAPSTCADLVPFCGRLTAYCPNFDKYDLINGTNEAVEVYQQGASVSICENAFMTHQRKMKMLVNLVCPKTCHSCLKSDQADKLVSKLQLAAKCA